LEPGPVKAFACQPMHRPMTLNLVTPSFNNSSNESATL
jgi:hypothetical protein